MNVRFGSNYLFDARKLERAQQEAFTAEVLKLPHKNPDDILVLNRHVGLASLENEHDGTFEALAQRFDVPYQKEVGGNAVANILRPLLPFIMYPTEAMGQRDWAAGLLNRSLAFLAKQDSK